MNAPRRWLAAEARFIVAPGCLVAAVILLAPPTPQFLSIGNIAGVAAQMWVLALLAVGQSFAIITRGFDISVGSVAALSSAVAALIANQVGPIGLLAGPIVGLGCGALNGLLIGSAGLQPIVATLGMLIGARGLALLVTGRGQVVPLQGAEYITGLAFDPVFGLPPICWGALAMAALAAFALRRSTEGRRIVMLDSNPQAVRLVGIDARRSYLVAYAVCGAFAGLAGLLLTMRAGAGLPTEGDGMALQAIAAAVIGGTALTGGVANIASVVAGAAFIQLLLTGLNLQGVSPFVAQTVVGAVIIGSGLVEYAIRQWTNHGNLQGSV